MSRSISTDSESVWNPQVQFKLSTQCVLLSGPHAGAGRAVLSHVPVHDINGHLRTLQSAEEAGRGVVRHGHVGRAQ